MSLTKYYISSTDGNDSNSGSISSPFKTIAPINALAASNKLFGSDSIAFKRGDVFSGMVLNFITSNFTERMQIHTYGYGDKPLFDMYKYIKNDAWVLHADNVWKIELDNVINFTGWTGNSSGNVGFIKVNGDIFGIKKKLITELTEQWDFWDNTSEGGSTLFVKSNGNPGFIYDKTEICVSVSGTSSIRLSQNFDIYDLSIMGHGAHACQAGAGFNNISYNNLDIKEIGGSALTSFIPNPTVRYGNGIELGGWGSDALIYGCKVDTVFDVAFTLQDGGGFPQGYKNVSILNNDVVNCEQFFEIYSKTVESSMTNIKVKNNISQKCGKGLLHFGHQSGYGYDQFLGVHLLFPNSFIDMDGVEISNNYFDESANGHLLSIQTQPDAIGKKLPNVHNNQIFLGANEKIDSINEEYKVRDYADFQESTGLEINSKFFEFPAPNNLSNVVRGHISSIAALKSKTSVISDIARRGLSFANRSLNLLQKSINEKLKVAVTLLGSASEINSWTKIAEVSLPPIVSANFSLCLSLNSANGDMQCARIIFAAKQSNQSINTPTTMYIDVESITGFARTSFFTEDGFMITNKGFGYPFVLYVKRANNFSNITVFEISKNIPVGEVTYFSEQPWMSIEPSDNFNQKSLIKVAVTTPNSITRRDSIGGLPQASVLLKNLPNNFNDAKNSNVAFQGDGTVSLIGEPVLNFNGVCEYLGDANKGMQIATEANGNSIYQRVHWFGSWRTWIKTSDIVYASGDQTISGNKIFNGYITAPGLTIAPAVSFATSAYATFSSGRASFGWNGTKGMVDIRGADNTKVIVFGGGTTDYAVIYPSYLGPVTTNGLALGTGSVFWSNAFLTNLRLNKTGILKGNGTGTDVSVAVADTDYVTPNTLIAGLGTKFTIPTGTSAQYVVGDGTIGTFASSVRTTTLTGLNIVSSGITLSDTVLLAFGKTQGQINNINTILALKAPLDSPLFTGTPNLPTGTIGVTQTTGDSSTKLATTAFVTGNFVDVSTNQSIGGSKTFISDTFIGVNGATNFTALQQGSISVYGASSKLARLFPTYLQFVNSTFSNTITQATLTANRTVAFQDKSGTVALLEGDSLFTGEITATNFLKSSDKRLKTELDELIDARNIKSKVYIKDDIKEIGYYAQDVEAVVPTAVFTDKEGFLKLDYTQILVQKIQNLEDDLIEASSKIKELEEQLSKVIKHLNL